MIPSPEHPALDELCDRIAELAKSSPVDSWPAERLATCAEYGVFRWFIPEAWGGLGWNSESITKGYLRLSQACLTTTFVITQRTGACRRIAGGSNENLKDELLPKLADGKIFATVGISHLTTSGQHLSKPLLRAEEVNGGFVLDGFSPWVTGGAMANHVVVGATLPDGRQILASTDVTDKGVSVPEPPRFVGLSGSLTGRVEFENAFVDSSKLIAGPKQDVMKSGTGANTGGLQTSTLALGLAKSAIEFLDQQASSRPNLRPIVDELNSQWESATSLLFGLVVGKDETCTADDLRTQANSLVLRSTQAALSAAKGTGYIESHPAGRWCCEALFFLVWSCPQGVVDANLCELAGIG